MRIGTLHGFGRRASIASIAVLIAFTAACGDDSTSDSLSDEVTHEKWPTTEATPEYCAELASFDDEVQVFQGDALVGGIAIEEVDPETLAAEADRLAQSASDLSTAAPPDIADALLIVAESLTTAHEDILTGVPPNQAVDVMADEAPLEAYEAIRTDLQVGGCAGMW